MPISLWTRHKLNGVEMTQVVHFGEIAKFMNNPDDRSGFFRKTGI